MGHALPFVVVGALLAPSLVPVAPKETSQSEEVKWAKSVAMDFLELATGESHAEVLGLLDPELAKVIRADMHSNSLDRISVGGYHGPKITTEEMAPNGSEVIFTGVLKGSDTIPTPDFEFRLRIAKESAQGRWSVRFMRFREREAKKNE